MNTEAILALSVGGAGAGAGNVDVVDGGLDELFEDEKDVTKPVAHKKLRVLLARLLEAVEHLAASGIVHADIKPDNILVHLDEEAGKLDSIKLVDFGSSFQHSE